MAKVFSGRKLRQLRSEAGYSREQLATAILRSWNVVYQYERGETRPSAEALEGIARFLNCRIDDLYEEAERV